ncbi:Uncharacterized protein dnm_055930 [Desulfonema magnum]|uniref:Uncharacterized protein n=1 Tax=Desulfonema magnum TaxID=45655 RepID=A0A975BQC3_9BACT|nr:Uncharacterized protein dnm_055930 [Desulfonema magnum]
MPASPKSVIIRKLLLRYLHLFFLRTAEKPGFFLQGRRIIPEKKPGFFPG